MQQSGLSYSNRDNPHPHNQKKLIMDGSRLDLKAWTIKKLGRFSSGHTIFAARG